MNSSFRIALLVGLSSGLTAFDETALGVALPTLQSDLATTATAAKWAVNAYLVAMAGLVAACGRLADFVPAQRLWRWGVAVFTVSSLGAGAAPGIEGLIAFRIVQGAGSAMIFTMSVVLIGQHCPPEKRGQAFGIFSSCATAMLLAGPILGGILTHYLSWRWVFWVTVPPALFCLLALRLPDTAAPRDGHPVSFDLIGAMGLAVAVIALSLTLMQGESWGWRAPQILGLGLLAVLSATGFVLHELRRDDPLIHLRLLRNPTVSIALGLLFLAQYRRVTTSIFIALFLRNTLGLSPLMAGLALVPAVLVLPVSTVLIGRLADQLGARPVVLTGAACVALATTGMTLATDLESYWILLPALLLAGTVAPSMFGPTRKAMLRALDPRYHAQIGGLSVTAQMLGGTSAISVGTVLLHATGATWPIFAVVTALLVAMTLVGVRKFAL
ncbi:MAG: MFS transporter [Paracoccaceae bacterium]